ncbi:sigma 54-interacting transcriptional regulator [Parachitinimonas caeni]|uniref:HTH-type transcriptional regulatory protein TyrR n=1 Tax=Parachitinimonas caeni TaxID=3031301 RepID=A0ABT7DQV2_9NEIS|nr:sigma 54-interacting transcriptional regulator [Parachitinimonas caeni]MDK2122448.1 sigma 54-interacting transcriptional regulator [Parachitinimonas caeni]
MRLDIVTENRLGITQEVLAVLTRHGVDVGAVEVIAHHIYIDAPSLDTTAFGRLQGDVFAVAGVRSLTQLDLLPGAWRRLQLDALLSALADPVLAIDERGAIAIYNRAFADAIGCDETSLIGRSLAEAIGDNDLARDLGRQQFRQVARDLTLRGRAYLVEARPITADAGTVRGGVLILHAASRIGERLSALQGGEAQGFAALIGESAVMRDLRARAQRVATVDAPLLIRGETGTGKELVARACHGVSHRRDAPFLALNCAALPESLAESELFGYAAGAFTGAQKGGKPGLLEMAQGGTVFLDEIGEMSLYLQAKLLRVLNDGRFRRVGGEREIRADVRIVSATHRPLEDMVRQGAFREDLYYRLNVLQLSVPALRERGEDILLLAENFVGSAAAQIGKPAPRLTPATRDALLTAPWPGNVRQLQNMVFRAVTLADEQALHPADFDLHAEQSMPDAGCWQTALDAFERDYLSRLYPLHPSSRKLAAVLGLSHTAVANKLRKYGIGG